jgi:hypothetical protein
MGERDAFGNEKGEDTLAGLGWTSGGATPAEPAPAPGSVPPPAPAATRPPAPPPPRPVSSLSAGSGVGAASANEAFGATTPTLASSSSIPPPPGIPRVNRTFSGLRLFGMLLRLVVPVVVLIIIGGTVFSVGDKVSDSVNDVRRAISTGIDEITVPTVTAEPPAAPAAAPVGLGKGSLLKAGNFRKAIALLRPEGSRARSVRVAADRIDATIVTASGFIRQVQITWEGERRRLSQTGPGFTQASTFTLSSLDAGAPSRLARSAAGRAKTGASSVDYVVAIPSGLSTQGWTAILKDDRGQYLADARGRITRRIN